MRLPGRTKDEPKHCEPTGRMEIRAGRADAGGGDFQPVMIPRDWCAGEQVSQDAPLDAAQGWFLQQTGMGSLAWTGNDRDPQNGAGCGPNHRGGGRVEDMLH